MYNVQGYIRRCLNSIFNQDFKDYELILVDDGSTDNTIDEAREVISKASKEQISKIILKDNSGASATRNLGIREAKGEFIIFMDADDQMSNDALSVMDKTTCQSEADLYVFSLKKEINGVIVGSELTKVDSFYIEEINSVRCLEKYLESTRYIITWQPWSKVFRKNIIKDNNIEFDTTLHSCNDFNFFMKYFLNVRTVSFTNTPTTIYSVDRPGSISGTKLHRRFESSTKAYSDMFNRIKCSGVESPVLLDYMSYLYLCSFDLVTQMSREQIEKVDVIVNDNLEIFYYSNNSISRLRRILFKALGYKKGAQAVSLIRYITNHFRKGNSEI